MNTLITRLATGLALALAAAAVTLWAPPAAFALAVMAVFIGALVEWNRLAASPASPAAVVAAAVAMTATAAALFFQPQKLALVCLAGSLFWVWLAVDLWRGNSAAADSTAAPASDSAATPLGNLAQGAVVLFAAWCALAWLRLEHGAAAALSALALVWAADTGAYFAGKSFGKRKLAPAISPGKTVAGVVGGIIGALAAAWALAELALGLTPAQMRIWLAAALAAAAFSVVGDLHESRLKRRAGVKDSGALLPGHGGILDRIDGLIAALPPFALIWQLR